MILICLWKHSRRKQNQHSHTHFHIICLREIRKMLFFPRWFERHERIILLSLLLLPAIIVGFLFFYVSGYFGLVVASCNQSSLVNKSHMDSQTACLFRRHVILQSLTFWQRSRNLIKILLLLKRRFSSPCCYVAPPVVKCCRPNK